MRVFVELDSIIEPHSWLGRNQQWRHWTLKLCEVTGVYWNNSNFPTRYNWDARLAFSTPSRQKWWKLTTCRWPGAQVSSLHVNQLPITIKNGRQDINQKPHTFRTVANHTKPGTAPSKKFQQRLLKPKTVSTAVFGNKEKSPRKIQRSWGSSDQNQNVFKVILSNN
jgi:hypothetical protein